MTDRITLNPGELTALDAVKFCLLKGTQPFRVDIMTLVRIIDNRRAVGEQPLAGKLDTEG